MTTKACIVCTGNTGGDAIELRRGRGKHGTELPVEADTLLARSSHTEFSVGPEGMWIHLTGTHGDESYFGDIEVRVEAPEWKPPSDEALGRDAYAAYCEAVGGTSYTDTPLPSWEQLGERQKKGWAAASLP